jgi:hypothetical protein
VIKAGETYGYLTAIKRLRRNTSILASGYLSVSVENYYPFPHPMLWAIKKAADVCSIPIRTKHMANSLEYRSWQEMKARCGGKDDVSIKHYVGVE